MLTYADQPIILDDDDSAEESTEDKVDNGAVDIDEGYTELDTSPQSPLKTSERTFRLKYAGTFGLWYDIEEDCYIDWSAPNSGHRSQRRLSSALLPDQGRTIYTTVSLAR